MKTTGEILHSARQTKGLSLEQLSALTKIDVRHIRAIENNDYQKLPSATFVKGFIRNLARALGKNPDELVAIFRRDYSPDQETTPSAPMHRPPKIQIGKFANSQIGFFILGLLTFIIYLAFQYRAVITPPKIEIINPSENAVIVSPVTIEGYTNVGSNITINDTLKIAPDSKGHFLAKLYLAEGKTEIKIKALSRFGRANQKNIPIIVLSSDN